MNDTTTTPNVIKWPADLNVNLVETLTAAGLSSEQIDDFSKSVLMQANTELISQVFEHISEESKQKIREAINGEHDAAEIQALVTTEYDSVQDGSKPVFEQLVDNSRVKAIASALIKLKQSANPTAFTKASEYLAGVTKNLLDYNQQ